MIKPRQCGMLSKTLPWRERRTNLMHELGIISNIIDTLEQVGRENKLTLITQVTLEIGEVSGVVPMFLTEYWQWAVEKSPLLKDSELKFETLEAVTYCENCGKTYETMRYAKICPHCGSDRTYLLKGNETNIKEIVAR